MKIAFDAITAAVAPYGSGRYTRGLMHGLMGVVTDEQIDFLGWGWRDFDYLKRQFPVISNPNCRMKVIRFPTFLKNFIERDLHFPLSGTYLRNQGYRVWHAPASILEGVSQKYLTTILTVHGLPFEKYPEYYRGSHLPGVVKQSVLRAEIVVADSEYGKQEIIDCLNIKKEQIQVIPCGLDPIFFQLASDESVDRIRPKYQLGEKYIVYIGGRRPLKNLSQMIRTFVDASESGFDVNQFVISGHEVIQDPELDKLLSDSKIGGCVKLIGHVPDDDLPALYRGSQGLFYATLHEGFGLPILEAMSQLTPVITSNCTASPETSGGHAQLVDPLNHSEIVQALLNLNQNSPSQQQLENAREYALSFTWQKTAASFLDLYKRVSR